MNAADVMNRDLKYIYPISRVHSIEQLLRVTAHNAFFVVTPLSTEDQYDRDTKHEEVRESNFMPQLYHRLSVHPVHPTTNIFGKRNMDGIEPEQVIPNSFLNTSPTLPIISEEYNESIETKPLILHGTILRSQLVTLLHKGVFFNEADDVSFVKL